MKPDKQLINNLRKDGRMALTELSKLTKQPVSTLHDKLKQHLAEKIVKPTILVNFEKLGYTARAHILLAVEPAEKEKLVQTLVKHENVNTLCRINNGWNVLLECAFKDMHTMEDFIEQLSSQFKITKKEVHYTLDEYKREGFLA